MNSWQTIQQFGERLSPLECQSFAWFQIKLSFNEFEYHFLSTIFFFSSIYSPTVNTIADIISLVKIDNYHHDNQLEWPWWLYGWCQSTVIKDTLDIQVNDQEQTRNIDLSAVLIDCQHSAQFYVCFCPKIVTHILSKQT